MAITITNTGADTFISDGSQNPSFNKNFIAGLTKATAINNPITGGLDSVLVLDNTNRSIVMAYSDITDINGSTPAALGLLDASQVASYLNNNFFDFGDSGLTSVATASPLTGDGTLGNPVTLEDGTNTGDIPIWDASGPNWVIQPNPSWNLEARRNVKTFTFEGGFGLSGGGVNGYVLIGTPLQRNSAANVTMLTPGEPNRGAIVQMSNSAGAWIKLMTPFVAGSYVVLNQTTTKKYYYRQKVKISAILGGSVRCGIIDSPATTVLGGFGFEIGLTTIKAFCNSGASYTYGANHTIAVGTWYDCEIEYQYVAGKMVANLYVDGILVSTASRTVASFSNNCAIGCLNAGGASTLVFHSDLIEYSIYG